MGAPKRSPSFSQRPGFPAGLRVLLVDGDAGARARTEAQLRECSYEVRLLSCPHHAHAAASWRQPRQSACVPAAAGSAGSAGMLAAQAAQACYHARPMRPPRRRRRRVALRPTDTPAAAPLPPVPTHR